MLLLFSVLLVTILIGSDYIITEKNSRYHLSGYWNLKPADREKVDLSGMVILSFPVLIITGRKYWKKV